MRGRVHECMRTAWHGTARRGTEQHAKPHHTTPRHATARHGTAHHALPRHSTARHATPRHATPRHATYAMVILAWSAPVSRATSTVVRDVALLTVLVTPTPHFAPDAAGACTRLCVYLFHQPLVRVRTLHSVYSLAHSRIHACMHACVHACAIDSSHPPTLLK